MKDDMTIRAIAKQWLKDNGYDGLWWAEGPCGCGFDDFAPCGECICWCVPAYKKDGYFHPADQDGSGVGPGGQVI